MTGFKIILPGTGTTVVTYAQKVCFVTSSTGN